MSTCRQGPLDDLRVGTLYRFADWPNPAVPNGRAGVYTVWRGDEFVYVGMAGRALDGDNRGGSAKNTQRATGLRSRLASHASGRRSGDQFCIYVFDRLVLPDLNSDQIADAAAGRLSLDRLTRDHIHDNLDYRFTFASDGAEARQLERQIQKLGLAGSLPLLNPLNASASRPEPHGTCSGRQRRPALRAAKWQ